VKARARIVGKNPNRIKNQCLKCRMPVKIIVASASSQAATESASRIDPPG
jgi:hypothetical protein